MTTTATGCPSSGRLRAHLDDPSAAVEAHLDDCPECRDLIVDLAGNAGLARTLIGALEPDDDVVAMAPGTGRAAGRPRHAWTSRRAVRPVPRASRRAPRLVAALPAMALVIALVAGVVLTPGGRDAVAQLLDTFRAERLEIVRVDPDAIGDLSGLADLGEVEREDVTLPVEVDDAAQAEAISGLIPPDADRLRAAVGAPDADVGYLATPGGDVLLTLVARDGNGVPASLDGAVLQLRVPPAVATAVGEDRGGVPLLIAGVAGPPEVTARNAALEEVRDFLLSREELPEGLRAQLAGIADWRHTLPLPLPTDRMVWDELTVAGVEGLAFGDDSGLGAAVVWQRDGLIRGLAGPQPRSLLLELAEG